MEKLPVPAWVVEQPLPDFPKARLDAVTGGLAIRLLDRQTRWSPGGHDYYVRVAYEVVDRVGLERAGRIAPSFDPETSTLAINFIRVSRNGVSENRLTETDITLLRQESELANGIMNGQITGLVELEDIRVGDTVDYAISGRIETPLWPHHFSDTVSLMRSSPIARQSYRLIWPSGKPLAVGHVTSDRELTKEIKGDTTIYSLVVDDIEPLAEVGNLPIDTFNAEFIQLSSMDSWSEVADWAVATFAVDDALPESHSRRLEQIAGRWSEPGDRMVAALRLVQSEIRYVGIASGLGSHMPRPPAVTIQRGYGDCKDKSVLLTAMLRRLGIEAVAVLASLSNGHRLPKLHPAINLFDHAIVRANLNGTSYWLDATETHQGGRHDGLVTPDYGYVLPIQPGQENLVRIKVAMPDVAERLSEETYTLHEEGDVGLELTRVTSYRGREANGIRRALAALGNAELARQNLDLFSNLYPGLGVAQPIEIEDDLDRNLIVLRESYKIDRQPFDENGFWSNLEVYAFSLRNVLPDSLDAERKLPLALPFGISREHVIRFRTPGRRLHGLADTVQDAPGVHFERLFETAPEELTIRYRLEVKERSVSIDDAVRTTRLAGSIADNTELSVHMNSTRPTLVRRLNLTKPVDPETERQIDAALKLVDDEKNIEALEAWNRLVLIHKEPGPLRGYLQWMRGALLLDLGRHKAALPILREASELHTPESADLYFDYITLLRGEGFDADAAGAIGHLLTRRPELITQTNLPWVGSLASDLLKAGAHRARDAMLIALARAQAAFPDDEQNQEWIYKAAILALARRGELIAGAGFVDHLSTPDHYVRLLMDKSVKPLWPALEERAGDGLSLLIEAVVSNTRAKAEAEPNNYTVQTEYLQALRQAGRSAEAIEFGKALASDWPKIEAVGDDAFWFVNEYAYALEDTGRSDDAIALIDKLLSLGLESHSDLISMAINRGAMLLNGGEFERALDAVEKIEELEGSYASDYGWMWIYFIKSCALNQVGRTAEAQALIEDHVADIADSNPSAQMAIWLCSDRLDAAKELMVNRIGNPLHVGTALAAFVQSERDKSIPRFRASLLRKARQVQQDDKVMAAFTAVARPIRINGRLLYWGDF